MVSSKVGEASVSSDDELDTDLLHLVAAMEVAHTSVQLWASGGDSEGNDASNLLFELLMAQL